MTTGSKTALIVRGGWDGHQPVEATDSFVPFLHDNGYDVRVEDSPAIYADTAYLRTADVIVQCMTMSSIESEQLRGLTDAVRAGTGLAGWHGGIVDSYRASSDYLQLTGGQFATHPAKAPRAELPGDGTDCFVDYRVVIDPAKADHPIVAGISDFDLTTEQYWVLSDAYNEVLATTTIPAPEYEPWQHEIVVPAVWTRKWGAGRIFVSTPGHDLKTLSDTNVRTIIERGILWASR